MLVIKRVDMSVKAQVVIVEVLDMPVKNSLEHTLEIRLNHQRVMASLGNSYATTALSGGGFGKTSLFFTNKRVYAKYKEYTTKGKSNVDAIIDLKEISGTLLSQSNPIALMVIGVLIALLGFGTAAMAVNPVPAIVGIIIGGIFVIRWWLHRTVLMEISFQGDRISIMLKGYSYETANQFHKSLRGYLATIKNI